LTRSREPRILTEATAENMFPKSKFIRMRKVVLTLMMTTVGTAFVRAQSPDGWPRDPKAIQEVGEGKRKIADASWWGFDPVNATAALQAAIRSGAATVIVPNVGKPWIIDPVFLESDQEIEFKRGVEIQARQGGFLDGNDSLFKLENKENIKLSGYGANLLMRKEDYRKAPYERAEWRHCLSLLGGTNIQILGIKCTNSGGDGIFVGRALRGRPYSKNITIKDFVSESAYRQGISVISVDGLLIEGAILRGTEGTEPSAGIDFEPDYPDERLVGITMKNCLVEKNEGYGILVAVSHLAYGFGPIQIAIEGGRVAENGLGALAVRPGKIKGRVAVRSTDLVGIKQLGKPRSLVVDISTESAVPSDEQE
jgi:hypothetical protein